MRVRVLAERETEVTTVERAASGLGAGGYRAALGGLLALVILNVPELGSDPTVYEAPAVHAQGPLAPLVRAVDGEWDVGLLRSAALLGGLLAIALAVLVPAAERWRRRLLVAGAAAVCALLLLPGVALQSGLRDSTEPWFYTNDSTYQIELAGDLLRDGTNPYGHRYDGSGLE